MTNPIIVMVARGKNDETDYVMVRFFETLSGASKFVAKVNLKQETNKSKYWETACIISQLEEIEINYQFNPNII